MHAVVTQANSAQYEAQIDEMFRHRKSIFVDTLNWSLPISDGVYEKDRFDQSDTTYLLILDKPNGRHVGSVRLLPTTEPHILGALFPELCADGVPADRSTWEVTRFCCAPKLNAKIRREIRIRIAISLVEFGLLIGLTRYTCVAELGWLSQILAAGWECEPLGPPLHHQNTQIGALTIKISPETLRLFWSRWGPHRTDIALEGAYAANAA